MPIYSKSGNFIFVHIYKTGGTSLRMALNKQFDDIVIIDDEHSSMEDLMDRYELANNPFSFTIVRNPYDWLVSLYCYIRQEKTHPDNASIRKKSFAQFLKWLAKKMQEKRTVGKVFYGRQTDFFCDKKGEYLIKESFKFEEINSLSLLLQKYCHFHNIKQFLIPHYLKGNRKIWQQYYTVDEVRLVNKLFHRDFQILGYKKIKPPYE